MPLAIGFCPWKSYSSQASIWSSARNAACTADISNVDVRPAADSADTDASIACCRAIDFDKSLAAQVCDNERREALHRRVRPAGQRSRRRAAAGADFQAD